MFKLQIELCNSSVLSLGKKLQSSICMYTKERALLADFH